MSSADTQDIIGVLASDHRAIEALLADQALITHDKEGLALRAQLVSALVRHFVAEEEYLFPALRNLIDKQSDLAADLAASAASDRDCENRLRSLEDETITEAGNASMVAEVRKAFSAHVAVQEGKMFPVLRRDVDTAELVRLGDEILGAEQLAPTRPRRIAPDSPALAKVTSLIEGYVDRARDHYSRRGVEPGHDGSVDD